jgi:hypothetical protein
MKVKRELGGDDEGDTHGQQDIDGGEDRLCGWKHLEDRLSGRRITEVMGLTWLALSLKASLAEMACSTLTTGLTSLNNLASPFLNLSNACSCSWNMARMDSVLWQLSIFEARGWLQRSFPVRFVYSVRAALKIVSKLEEVELVLEAEVMG